MPDKGKYRISKLECDVSYILDWINTEEEKRKKVLETLITNTLIKEKGRKV